MLRYLRIAVSVLCLSACVLLIALWVRSYHRVDIVHGRISLERAINVHSETGRMGIFLYVSGVFPIHPSMFISVPVGEPPGLIGPATWACGNHATASGGFVIVPHWFLLLVAAALAAALWIKRPYRFSLRTLLIAMMLFAVLLAIIAISN